MNFTSVRHTRANVRNNAFIIAQAYEDVNGERKEIFVKLIDVCRGLALTFIYPLDIMISAYIEG